MVGANLRRYDVQATYAMALALFSLLPLSGASYLLIRNYRSELGAITYRSEFFLPALLACLALAAVMSLFAILFGYNSAGQRRNEKPLRSWMGFLIGSLSLTVAVVGAIAFGLLRWRAVIPQM